MKKIILFLLIILPFITNAQKFPQNEYPEGFLQAVAEGRIKGYSLVQKYGLNENVTTTGTPEDIWETGGTYNYDADSTAPIKYLSSSNVNDDEPIIIEGLDSLGNEVVQIDSLNGQNSVTLSTPLWRVFRMINYGDTSLLGTVYCHTAVTTSSGVPDIDSIRATIDDGNNQTLMALYTIPKGKVGFIYRGELGVEFNTASPTTAEYARVYFFTRQYGKVFTVKKSITLMVSAGNYVDTRVFPYAVPSLTDIKMTAKEVSLNMGLWATLDILLVDEKMFSDDYLHSIGQPGY